MRECVRMSVCIFANVSVCACVCMCLCVVVRVCTCVCVCVCACLQECGYGCVSVHMRVCVRVPVFLRDTGGDSKWYFRGATIDECDAAIEVFLLAEDEVENDDPRMPPPRHPSGNGVSAPGLPPLCVCACWRVSVPSADRSKWCIE